MDTQEEIGIQTNGVNQNVMEQGEDEEENSEKNQIKQDNTSKQEGQNDAPVQVQELFDIYDALPEIADGIEDIKAWSEKLRTYEICKQLGCVWSVRRGLTNDIPDKSIKYECTGLRGVQCFAKFQMVKEQNQRYYLKVPYFLHTHPKLSEKEIEYKLSRIRSRKKQIILFKSLKDTQSTKTKEEPQKQNDNLDLVNKKKRKKKDVITHNQKLPPKKQCESETESFASNIILFEQNQQDMNDEILKKQFQSQLQQIKSQKQEILKLEKQSKIHQQIIANQKQQMVQIEKAKQLQVDKLKLEIDSLKSETVYYQLEVKKLKQTLDSMNE